MAVNSGGDIPAASANDPLKILVVGAGIRGLTAAIALRQQGHIVEVFEQSRLSQETGAAIHLTPNSNGLLRRLGLNAEDIDGVNCTSLTNSAPDGTLRSSMKPGDTAKIWGHPWHLVHCAHLHTALRQIASSERGEGRPASLHLSSRVKQADPATATITFEDGTQARGDLLIGADGVHSRTRKAIPGGDLVPFDSGKSTFRFLIATERLASDPTTAGLVSRPGFFHMYIGEDRRFVLYPCVSNTLMNFAAIYPSKESAENVLGDSWHATGSKAKLLEIFKDFCPTVLAVLDKTDESDLKVWNLLDMEKMPGFAFEKLAVLGDAAHPFLPYQGQGGGQAIEDGISLAAMLPLGTPKQAIPERLQLYERCRYERAHKLQEFTRLAGMNTSELAAEGKVLDMSEYIKYNFGHDEYEASMEALKRYLS